jgi:hypothetical protein
MTVSEYVDKRIRRISEIVKPFNPELWNHGKTVISIEFFPIEYDTKDLTAFIPTGSKDKPSGIASINDAFLLFIDKDKNRSSFYYHVDLMKKYMSANPDKLSSRQESDKDFRTIGYRISLEDFTSFVKNPSS